MTRSSESKRTPTTNHQPPTNHKKVVCNVYWSLPCRGMVDEYNAWQYDIEEAVFIDHGLHENN
eukprot:scaffold2761_cov137-Skeletonema_menzelii.AAC.7